MVRAPRCIRRKETRAGLGDGLREVAGGSRATVLVGHDAYHSRVAASRSMVRRKFAPWAL